MKALYKLANRIFECICIILTIYMTIQQVQIYSRNEDSSAISLRKFTEDQTNDNYPTFTICFEDSNRGDIYLKFTNPEETAVAVNFETLIRPIDDCPYYALENNKFFCSNNSNTDSRKNFSTSGICEATNVDDTKAYQYQQPSFIDWMSDRKKYLISTDHYRNLLMGKKTKYIGERGHQCDEIKYSIKEIAEINFDEEVVDLTNYLKDFSIKTENGSSYGWIDKDYEHAETYCGRSFFYEYGEAICGTQNSFKASVESRLPSFDPPFMKVYQDPLKICYSPRLKPEWFRKHHQFTLDISEMKKSFLKSRSDNDSPVLTFHLHMKGQFMRSIGKEHLSLNKYDLVNHCPILPKEATSNSGRSKGRRGRGLEESNGETKECFGVVLSFDISQVTLLQNRPDANVACDPKLKDEDFKIMEAIVSDAKLNCIPIFWLGLHNFSSEFPKCKENHQYERIRELMVNFTLVSDTVRSKYDPPCEELMIESSNRMNKGRSVKTNHKTGKSAKPSNMVKARNGYGEHYLDFKIRQGNDRYQMIKNNREFTVESCLSGIGGFIGMLIGLSLKQLPEILRSMYNFLK